MKNLSSWLIAFFALMYWAFRIIVTFTYSMGMDFVTQPIDMTMEIVLLFVTFICICFIFKRNLLTTLIYFLAHLLYFGSDVLTGVGAIMDGQGAIDIYTNLFFDAIGILIPHVALIDVLLDKNRKLNPTDKKTDWFYKNKDYDRKLDERADKNNYRTGL